MRWGNPCKKCIVQATCSINCGRFIKYRENKGDWLFYAIIFFIVLIIPAAAMICREFIGP